MIIIPNFIKSFASNTTCKINEIFNETLKRCINNSNVSNDLIDDIIFNETMDEIVSISSKRVLQRTGENVGIHSISLRPMGSSRYDRPHLPVNLLGKEGYINMYQKRNHIPDELYFFIIIFMSIMAYNYGNKIKRFFKL